MFKESFKYYKSKNPTPSFENVIDFDTVEKFEVVSAVNNINLSERTFPGLLPTKLWQIYKLKDRPGLLVVKNPFTPTGQRYWITKCLQNYPLSPNVTNLTPELYSKEISENWWTALNSTKDDETKNKIKQMMRWVTLGYHYDWTNKIYDENLKSQFPVDLEKLTIFVADTLGFSKYAPQAAIVNYYPFGSTLAGHTDHSEINLEAPLFSFSFGQTGIFLIGGESIDEKPTAMFLKSGDIVIMTKQSRLCYHAVPRIIPANNEPWLNNNEDGQETPDQLGIDSKLWESLKSLASWNDVSNYMKSSRININVRQVLRENQKSLNDL